MQKFSIGDRVNFADVEEIDRPGVVVAVLRALRGDGDLVVWFCNDGSGYDAHFADDLRNLGATHRSQALAAKLQNERFTSNAFKCGDCVNFDSGSGMDRPGVVTATYPARRGGGDLIVWECFDLSGFDADFVDALQHEHRALAA